MTALLDSRPPLPARTPATSSSEETRVRRFQALADPTRLAVLDALREGERCVCDLQDLVGAAQSRLSFHLRVLRDAGLVHDRREGRWSYYRLCPDALGAMHAELGALAAERPPRRLPQLTTRCCQ